MSACMLSHISPVQLFVTPWTVARQIPLSMGFSRQEYWGGLPCPLPGDLPDPGIEHMSPVSPALTGGLFTTSTTREAQIHTRNSEDTVTRAPSILKPYKIRGEGRCDSWLDGKYT